MNDHRRFKLLSKILFWTALGVPLLLFALSTVTGQTQTQPKSETGDTVPPTDATYVGSEMCAACHEDIATAFAKNPHGSKAFEMKSDKSCEACHGPGSAHSEEGNPDLIISFKRMSASQASETCLDVTTRGCRLTGREAFMNRGS